MRNLLLAERFHVKPLEIEDDPIDRWLVYMHVMGIQGDVQELTEGLPHDEPLTREDDA